MSTSAFAISHNAAQCVPSHVPRGVITTHPLGGEHTTETLEFLAVRPLYTVCMASYIRDNGIVSPLNRGTFHACRDAQGKLEGVALIGHATFIEARSERSLAAFARIAQDCPNAFMILGEQQQVCSFWQHYSQYGQPLRLACRESLMELHFPVPTNEPVVGLRLATLADLNLVAPVQAQMAFDESGVNPLERDPEGFRRRCARRIEQKRVWVLTEGNRLIFKADVIAETPENAYLEGVYVAPEDRGKGYGVRCMSQLVQIILSRTGSVTVLVNENNVRAQTFYRKAGYRFRATYDTIFLRRDDD